MAMARWTPFFAQTLNDFEQVMKQLFQDVRPRPAAWAVLAPSFPPVNLWEDDENLYVEAELPGLPAEQLGVTVTQGNQLTIEGDRPSPNLAGTWRQQERGFGKFSRLVELPVAVDADKVVAHFEQGVLALKLPKAAAAKPRRIAVQA